MKNQKEKSRNQSHSPLQNKKRIIIKYIGRNLPKKTKELYTENYKTLVKKIKDDINRWRGTPCSLVGRINIVKNEANKMDLTYCIAKGNPLSVMWQQDGRGIWENGYMYMCGGVPLLFT